jgi:ABC-2 type transport system ATP-binding protein
MTQMIEARGLVHTFHTGKGKKKKKPVHAVTGIDLDVAEGEVVGFLGPNGAGNTTTLRMLVTLLKPTAGTAGVAGYDVATQPVQVRRSIGYCSQVGSTFSGAYAGDEVVDHGMLYGMSRKDAVARGQRLFEEFELDGLWRRMPKNMSGGQKRRLDVVMGLIHDPSLIFLDEPTTGLDPQARANLWEHIRGLRDDRGATVFLTTHYLDEADTLADRIIIIDRGEIVASDTADNLKANVSGDLVSLEVAADDQVAVARDKLGSISESVDVEGRLVRGRVARAGKAVPGLLRDLDSAGVSLDSIEVARPTLDDVFLTLTGRTLRDAESDATPQGPDDAGDPPYDVPADDPTPLPGGDPR